MKIINTILVLLLICASPVIFADQGYGHHGYHGHAKHHEYRGHHRHHEHRGYHR